MTVAEDGPEDHGHLPAVEDWPRGFGEASWWPFVTAVGASGFYVGVGLYVLGHGGSNVVGPWAGPGVFVASTFVFLFGLYGWLYHAFVKNFWERGTDEHAATKLRWGMVTFLTTEVATFSAGFVYYFFVRVGASWPPEHLPNLVSSLVLVNTAILVASSFTLHFAHTALRRNDRRRFLALLGVTLLLGLAFVGGQVLEYYEFIVEEGFGIGSGIFASGFYGLTGLHGLHVSLGAVLIGIVFARALLGQYSADREVSIATVSMYWHFVDAVWIFLVVVLYVGAAASP